MDAWSVSAKLDTRELLSDPLTEWRHDPTGDGFPEDKPFSTRRSFPTQASKSATDEAFRLRSLRECADIR